MGNTVNKSSYVIVVDLGGTNLRTGIVSEDGKILTRIKVPTPKSKVYEEILYSIKSSVENVKKMYQEKTKYEILGLGVGVAGVMDRMTEEVVSAFNVFGQKKVRVNLHKDLEELTGFETKVDNDVNLAALGEYWLGAGRGSKNIVCIFIGTGIGSGIIINGELYRGSRGAAGEIAHITLDKDGPQCGCGNYGCFERLAAGPAIAERAIQKIRNGGRTDIANVFENNISEITPEIIFEAAKKGDSLANEVVLETCIYLGIGIATVINLFNPELVIIGGGIGKEFKFIIEPVWKEVKRRARIVAVDSVKIIPSLLWDDAALLGAAKLFFNS